MIAFTQLAGVALHLPGANIDTDQIIPAQFLTGTDRAGLGDALFHNLRRDEAGRVRALSPFDTPPFARAAILITGENFGCGSSREHAAWALLDFGIRCVVAPSFGDIFRANCAKNGMLTIALDPRDVDRLASMADGSGFVVDLDALRIDAPDGSAMPFSIDPVVRRKLLAGLDDIGETLQREQAILRFEAARQAAA